MLRKMVIIFVLCFVLQSCENLNDPGEAEFKNSIIFRLQTGTAKQQLYVYPTFPISFTLENPILFDGYENPLVEDAEISIIKNNEIYNAFEIVYKDSTQQHKYYTNQKDLIIKPNSEYNISVKSNGEKITGRILTVGEFEIIKINKEDNNNNDYFFLNIEWERAANVRFYSIKLSYKYWIKFPDSPDTLKNLVGGYTDFFDTDTAAVGNTYIKRFDIRSSADSIEVEIAAFDQNAYDYFIRGIKRVGVENAYGYLGSYTFRKKKIVFNGN